MTFIENQNGVIFPNEKKLTGNRKDLLFLDFALWYRLFFFSYLRDNMNFYLY